MLHTMLLESKVFTTIVTARHKDLRQVVTWVLLKLRLCQFMWCIGHSNYDTIKQSNLRTHQETVFPHGTIESEILLALEQFKF